MKKVKQVTTNIIEDNHARRIIFRTLMVLLALLGILYVYFIMATTFNILARRTLESKVQSYSSNIGQLEVAYFSGINKISKNYALANGFVEAHNSLFVTRTNNSYVAIR